MRYKGWNCFIDRDQYSNGRDAISIIDSDDGELIAVATSNIPEIELEEDEVFVKDYSENEGVLDFLVANNIVNPPHRFVPYGYVTFPVCRLVS